MPRLILASDSPRRRELLTWAGLSFEVQPSRIEESVRPGESPAQSARRLARAKALQVAARFPQAWVLAADTVVVLDGQSLGKPGDRGQAAEMLTRLSGRSHEVMTAFCLACQELGQSLVELVRTEVEFRRLSAQEIAAYAASGEPLDKAGAYAIQGRGGALVRRLSGSYTNVVGLPLAEVLDALRRCGLEA